MKCEDGGDNSFPPNTSIPSPSIDEAAVLEEPQQAAVICHLSAFRSSLVLFSTLGFFFIALDHRNTERKWILKIEDSKMFFPLTFTSPLVEMRSAADAGERAEGNSKRLFWKNAICRYSNLRWTLQSEIKSHVTPFSLLSLCCQLSSSDPVASGGKIKSPHSSERLSGVQCHRLRRCRRCSMIDERVRRLSFSLSAVNRLDGHKYQQTLLICFIQSPGSILLIKLTKRVFAVVTVRCHCCISALPRCSTSAAMMKTAANCGCRHDASRWNEALWKLHRLEIPQRCSTCTPLKVPRAPTWRFARAKSEPDNRILRHRFLVYILGNGKKPQQVLRVWAWSSACVAWSVGVAGTRR